MSEDRGDAAEIPELPVITRAHREHKGHFTKKNPPPTAWKPGQSGNPSGRPASERVLAEFCRSASLETSQILLDIARDKRAQGIARVQAIKELQERGYGKAPQQIKVETDVSALDNQALAGLIRGQLEMLARTIEGEVDPVESGDE